MTWTNCTDGTKTGKLNLMLRNVLLKIWKRAGKDPDQNQMANRKKNVVKIKRGLWRHYHQKGK